MMGSFSLRSIHPLQGRSTRMCRDERAAHRAIALQMLDWWRLPDYEGARVTMTYLYSSRGISIMCLPQFRAGAAAASFLMVCSCASRCEGTSVGCVANGTNSLRGRHGSGLATTLHLNLIALHESDGIFAE